MPGQVNGQFYQHALIDLSSQARQGVAFTHRLFSALSFNDEGEGEPVLDSRGEIVGWVMKPRKADGSITLKLMEWDEWLDWLRQQAALLQAQDQRPYGPGQVIFTMTVAVGATIATTRQRRIRAKVQKDSFDSKDDQNALEVTIPLLVLDVTDDQGRRFVERGA